MSVRLPRLLGEDLSEKMRLYPSRLQVDIKRTPLSRATMSLPECDPDVPIRSFVELYNARGSLGIFRVSSVTPQYGKTQAVGLKHGLTVLSDGVTGEEETITGNARSVLIQLLSCQTQKIGDSPFWTLGVVDVPDNVDVSIPGKHANLLQSALDILKLPGINGKYMYTFDQSVFPWVLSLVELTDNDACEARVGRNLTSVSPTYDDSDMTTRVYADELENGYMEVSSPFGIVSRTISIPDGVNASQYAKEYLENHKEPRSHIKMDAVELYELTGDSFDRFYAGRMCRVPLPSYGVFLNYRVETITYEDLMSDPDSVTIEMSNMKDDTSYYLANQTSETGKNSSRISSNSRGLAQHGLNLRATREDLIKLDNLTTKRFNDVQIDLDEMNAVISLKASQELVNEAIHRISQAEIDIDGANALIALKASTESVNELGERVTDAEASLTVQAGQIKSKVSKNGVISSINQTAEEIKISASKINLSGFVTASQMSSEFAVFQQGLTEKATIMILDLGTLRYRGNEAKWKSKDVVISVSGRSTGEIAVRDASGKIIGTALTGYRVTYSTETIHYMGY